MAHFRNNAAIARTHVQAQQLKGWFMAKAQQLAIIVSALMMSIGILLQYTGIKLLPTWDTFFHLLAAGPIAVIVVVFAILVEGMTIITSSGLKEARKKVDREIFAHEKANAKHPGAWTKEEFEKKKKRIYAQMILPGGLLFIFCGFSFLGGELFWHALTRDSDLFIQVIGYILGGVVCVSLIYLELHHELVELGVERSISSSHLIYRAMDMDAKGQVLDELSRKRQEKLKSAEFTTIITEAAEQSLFAPLAETLQNMGDTIGAPQLREQVRGVIQEREAANLLAKGMEESDKNTDAIAIPGKLRKRYNTEQARKCKDHIKRYGHSNVSEDVEKHAEMIGVAPNTLRRYLG